MTDYSDRLYKALDVLRGLQGTKQFAAREAINAMAEIEAVADQLKVLEDKACASLNATE
jgi:hypothetical protein